MQDYLIEDQKKSQELYGLQKRFLKELSKMKAIVLLLHAVFLFGLVSLIFYTWLYLVELHRSYEHYQLKPPTRIISFLQTTIQLEVLGALIILGLLIWDMR